MDTGLRGKVAVVTGASQGLGEAIAIGLREEGCKLAILARRQEKLDELAARLAGGLPDEVLAIACDVTVDADVTAAFDKIRDRFQTVDILVNNAGGPNNKAMLFEDIDEDMWRQTLELNVISLVRVTRHALPFMIEKQWGRIINISSESAQQPDATTPDYNSAKAAVNTFTKSLSKSHGARGILTNSVAPAFTTTPLMEEFVEREAERLGVSGDDVIAGMLANFRPHIEVKRPGRAEEVAAAVVFLASEKASFINGCVLRVDGGSVASI